MASDPAPLTFPALLEGPVHAYGERVFLPRRQALAPEPVTFATLRGEIDDLAAALLELGLRHGDRVGLVAENRYEWLLVDLALASVGAPDVPRGAETAPSELAAILGHSGARFCFCEDDEVARDVLALRAGLPALERVFVMAETTTVADATALGELLRAGHAVQRRAKRLREARAAVRPDDLLTVVYTSGTTASPKGVMLTHENVLANVRDCRLALDITGEDRFLSVLPAWHMYERVMDYLALAVGGQLVYTDRRNIKEDLAAVRPTVFAAVPRIWEMLHDGVHGRASKAGGVGGLLLRTALRVSREVGGRRARLGHRVAHRVLRALVLEKILAAFGGQLRLCVSGGGALPRHVDETLLGIGLPLLNGYGLTETSPVASVRRPERNDPGHIGPPLPGTRIEARRDDGRVCGPGETGVLWIQGPQVMRGYYRNPERTTEVLREGWFCSGDLGHVDAQGHVWITGRAKDTIVLASGENVEPEPVEALIKTSPYVEQVICVGQDRKTLGALLVPAAEALEGRVPRTHWDERDGVLQGAEVRALFRAEFDRILTRGNGCRPWERVSTFAVLAEPLTPENGLMTQTLKVKRHAVAERYAALMARLYGA